jgi:hypothetical protein
MKFFTHVARLIQAIGAFVVINGNAMVIATTSNRRNDKIIACIESLGTVQRKDTKGNNTLLVIEKASFFGLIKKTFSFQIKNNPMEYVAIKRATV